MDTRVFLVHVYLGGELHRAGLCEFCKLRVQHQREKAVQPDGRCRQQVRHHGLPVAVPQARHRRRRHHATVLRQSRQQLLRQAI